MDWEQRYVDGDTPWEKGGEHPVMTHLQGLGWFDDWRGQRVICPGAGLGHDVQFLAQEAGAEAVGWDISTTAIERAQALGDGRQVLQRDIFIDRDKCAGVWEHTCFCAIDPARRVEYLRALGELLPAGGVLQGVFFINPDHDRDGPPFGVKKDELVDLLAPLFLVDDAFVPGETYEGREDRELCLRAVRR